MEYTAFGPDPANDWDQYIEGETMDAKTRIGLTLAASQWTEDQSKFLAQELYTAVCAELSDQIYLMAMLYEGEDYSTETVKTIRMVAQRLSLAGADLTGDDYDEPA